MGISRYITLEHKVVATISEGILLTFQVIVNGVPAGTI